MQLLDGLKYLASNGLEHGSLSCSNVLLSSEGEVKISKLAAKNRPILYSPIA